jgi:hypothetical protein
MRKDTFGGRIVELFSILQSQVCKFALTGIEPNTDLLAFCERFKDMMIVYLNNRNVNSKRFMMLCAENADAIRLGNHDVIQKILNTIQEVKND